MAQDLTERQLEEAQTEIEKQTKEMVKNGAFDSLTQFGSEESPDHVQQGTEATHLIYRCR